MSLQRNIRLGYFISALGWGRFYIPVLALFYLSSMITVAEFTIIVAVFAFTILLLELPSGIFSDLVGRRKTLIIA